MMDDNHIPSAYESPELDRGDLTVSGRRKKNKLALVAIAVIAIAVVLIAVFVATQQFGATEAAAPEVSKTQYAEVAGVDKGSAGNDDAWFEELKREREQEKAQEARALERERQRQLEAASAESTPPQSVPTYAVPEPRIETAPANETRNEDAPPTPQERRLTGNIMVNVEGGSDAKPAPNATTYDDSYNAPTFAMGSATKRATNGLDFLLRHGSVISCALYSQIISDYQGIVTCRVTQDVYSANGKALLVERGSLLTGTQSVQLEAGKNRVFTTWADIETPNGVAIRIDSLGAGPLGASGNEAWVDNHFKERFGGAILLSFLDDAFGALAEKAASSDGDITFDSSTENASNMAEKALESTINIAPTGYTKIGQRISIIVARDIDMSSVYAFQ